MHALQIVLAGLCASTATSLVLSSVIRWDQTFAQECFVEVLPGGLVRTNVDEDLLDMAIDRVLKANRLLDPLLGDRLEPTGRHCAGVPWFSPIGPVGCSEGRSRDLYPQQLDQLGRPLQIEVFEGSDLPTLVYVHHDDRRAANRVAHHLALKLAERGVTLVN